MYTGSQIVRLFQGFKVICILFPNLLYSSTFSTKGHLHVIITYEVVWQPFFQSKNFKELNKVLLSKTQNPSKRLLVWRFSLIYYCSTTDHLQMPVFSWNNNSLWCGNAVILHISMALNITKRKYYFAVMAVAVCSTRMSEVSSAQKK